jgi:hypothetical protein
VKLPKLPETSDKPKNLRETIFTSTPVVLTVLATILAGLSSGELTRSQYFRSLAAQRQAKASDQWGYYQAKRLRSVEAQNALDLLVGTAHSGRLDLARLAAASAKLAQLDKSAAALEASLPNTADVTPILAPYASVDGRLPEVNDKPVGNDDLREAMADIDLQLTEAQMAPLLKRITEDQLTEALQTNDANLKTYDQSLDQAAAALDRLHAIFSGETEIVNERTRKQPADAGAVARDIAAAAADVATARLRLAAARYDREARYNSVSGDLYEVMVRQSGVYSDRYRVRSSQFFYGMLVAQAGVTISTLSLAVRRRSIFWSVAALAGAAAVGFSGYIYLYT